MTHKKGIQVFLNNNLNLHPREQFCEFKKRYIIYIYYYKDQNPQKLLDWKAKMEPNSLFTKKRRDTNLVFFSFCFCIQTVLEEGSGSRTSRRCAAQALERAKESLLLVCEDAAPPKQQMWCSKWSLREPRQNRHMQRLLTFPRFPEENASDHGKWEDVVSEMRVQAYQCHAVDSVNSTCWNTTFFISAAILFVLFSSDTQAHQLALLYL